MTMSITPSSSPASRSQSDQPSASASPLGDSVFTSPTLNKAIDDAVQEVRMRTEQINDVRPPREELKESYESLMVRAADVRGRGLLYPYLGSGLGNGALVELADGSVKWDMIGGIGVNFFGHSHPDLLKVAVRGSLEDVLQHGNLQAGFESYRFGELLLQHAKKNSRLAYCYATTSGAMANENALKVCYQKHAPASRVIAFNDCFMGRSVTMSQIGDTAAYRQGVPLSTLVDYIPFYDHAMARTMSAGDASGSTRYIDMCAKWLRQYVGRYPKQHACFIFELIQGEGGFNTAPREFFVELMEICKGAGIAVWDDEIQSFGRTERMFAYETLDLGQYVDVFCVGKMTQVCATLYTADYNPGPGLLSGTFTSSGPAFAVGTRVLELLAAGDYYGPDGLIAKHHQLFVQQVRALAAKHPEWFPDVPGLTDIVGGIGGMMRFTPFGGDKDKITKACKHLFDEHVIAFYCGHGPYHLRMLPPLGVFEEQDWPRVFACIEKGLAKTFAENS